jgi:hypothetical protein
LEAAATIARAAAGTSRSTPSRSGAIPTSVPFEEGREPAVGAGAADRELSLAAVRKVEQAREAPARQLPAGVVERQRHRRRKRGSCLSGDGLHSRGRDGRTLHANGERDGQPLEACERGDDRRGGGFAVELPARSAGHDLRVQAAEAQRGVAVRLVDLASQLRDDEVQRRLVHLGRRVDVGAEDADADPA